MHTGRISTLCMIFMLNYKELEVVMKYLDMNNSLYNYVKVWNEAVIGA